MNSKVSSHIQSDRQDAKQPSGRVGFITTWNQRCGLATYARFLIEQFDTRDVVIFADRSGIQTTPDESNVVRCWSQKEDDGPAQEYSELESAIRDANIDSLYINCQPLFFSEPNFGAFLKRIKAQGIKVVVHLHCLYSLGGEVHSLVTHADKVIVHAAENRMEAIACGAQPDVVHVVPHGVAIREQSPTETKASLRTKLGLPLNEHLIVSFGFVQTHKGFDAVIEAVQHLRRRGLKTHGVIVGQTRNDSPRGSEYLGKLQSFAASVGDGTHISFVTDYVPDEVIGEYVAAADLVMLDYRSRYIESSGACALALGAGALVMGSLAPAMLAFGDAIWHITDGYKAGISAEVLLTNEQLREELHKRAKAYCTAHSWSTIATKISDIFRSIGLSLVPKHQRDLVQEKEKPVTTTYAPKKAIKPLRILMQNRATTFSARGGDTVVLERLRDGLIERGCQVTVDVTGQADPRQFDLVHLFNFATPDVTRARAEVAVQAGVPFVVTTLYEEVPEFHNQSQAIATRLKEYVERQQNQDFWRTYKIDLSRVPRAPRFDNEWVASRAAALFANGESEKLAIQRDFPRATVPTVVTLGHEVGPRVSADAFVKQYGVKDFVLCVGRFESRKNQLMVLKALENSDLTVVFAGGGFTYQPDYTEAVRSFKRKGRTIVLDRLSPEMLASAYAACRVHVLASWFELPGLVSLEAASYGKNIVATRTGTTADYLGATAFYCSPWDEDSIESAITAAYYSPVRPGLTEMAARYTWDATVDQTLGCYEKVLGIKEVAAVTVESSVVQPVPMPVYDGATESMELQDTVERGEIAAQNEDFETAMQLLKKAEALNPSSVRTLKALGAVSLATNMVAEALGYFEKAMVLAPGDIKVLTGRGMCEVLRGEFKTAMPYFERAVQADPMYLVGINQLLRCGYQTGDLASSEVAITRYLEGKSDDSAMRFCLAGCLYRGGKFEQAQREIERVIQAQPTDDSARELKKLIDSALPGVGVAASPDANRQQGEPVTVPAPTPQSTTVAENSPRWSAITDLNDSLAALSEKIATWKVGGDDSAAVVAPAPTAVPEAPAAPQEPEQPARRISTVPPMVPGENTSQASGYIESKLCVVEDLRRDRKMPEARKAFEAIRGAVGMTVKQERRVQCLEAEFAVLDGDLVTAEKIYDSVLTAEPTNPRALSGKGALAAEAQRWSDARQFFERALATKPDYDVAFAGLGVCEMVSNNGETAFELFRKAALSNPENQRALLGVMQVGYPLKKYNEIEALLSRYLDLHPASTDMLYSFAGVLFAQGKMQQARMEVEKILLFEPTNSRAIELRNMIDTGGKEQHGTILEN